MFQLFFIFLIVQTVELNSSQEMISVLPGEQLTISARQIFVQPHDSFFVDDRQTDENIAPYEYGGPHSYDPTAQQSKPGLRTTSRYSNNSSNTASDSWCRKILCCLTYCCN